MTEAVRNIVNLADLSFERVSHGARFAVDLGNIGNALGLNGLGATLHVVAAGKTAWPFHRHHAQDELFLVLSGNGEVRIGDQRLPIRAGDCIGCPAGGEAHQIINSSHGELRYIAFSNHARAEVVEYPDSGRIAVDMAEGTDKPRSEFHIAGKLNPFGYWEGENGEGQP